MLSRPPGDGPMLCHTRVVLEGVETQGKTRGALICSGTVPQCPQTSACFGACWVSTCSWRCREIGPTACPLPLPLCPFHAGRWQSPADTSRVSTAVPGQERQR